MYYKRAIACIRGVIGILLPVIVSCARESAPSGGPKDIDPPVIVKQAPDDGSVMFSEKEFVITFDEFVVLDRINDKFMVSPPLTKKPEIKLRGRSLVVSWDEDLADSTTYTFYFQDAVRDNNESNPVPSLQYVFSTGPVLDSLAISGNVFNSFDLETVPDIFLALNSNLSDTAPATLPPSYIARPDNSGGFTMKNLKPGDYRLYALKDNNGNRMYDLSDEIFGFIDTVIRVTPSLNAGIRLDSISHSKAVGGEKVRPDIFTFGQYRVYTFTSEAKRQYLKFTERRLSGGAAFGLAMPLDSSDLSVEIVEAPGEAWYMEHNARCDSFRIWITAPEVYRREMLKFRMTYPFTDSTGSISYKTDTILLRHQAPLEGRQGGRQPRKTINTNLVSQVRPSITGWFSSNTPLAAPDTSKMLFTQTTDTVSVNIRPAFITDTTDSRRVFLATPLKPGSSYTLICKKGAFRDIFETESDSSVYKFSVMTPDNYGKVTALVAGYEGQVIVQLLGEKEKVVRESVISSPGKAIFGLLDKGKYRLRVIYDTDSNGKWTTGDYEKKRQPEPVTYFTSEIDVKINWEIEEEWDIGKAFVKDVALRNKPEAKK